MTNVQKRINARKSNLKRNKVTTSKSDLDSQIANYKTRLENVGKDPEEVTDNRNGLEKLLNLEKDQNVLFDIFEILDRPRNALFTGVQNALEGESFGEGLWEGLSGQTDTSGKDILVDNLGMNDEEGKLNISDVLGFGLDIVGDPTNWATFGGKSLADIGVDAAGKVLKKTAKVGDNIVELGLKGLDKAADAKIAKRAAKEGFENVDDFVKAVGFDKGTSALESYKGLKKGFVDTFNQGKTKVGQLIGSKRAAKSSNELLDDVYRQFKEPLEELSYDYVLKNSKNVSQYADDLADLTKFTSKDGNTITKWVKNNPNKELAKALSTEQSNVADDILRYLESKKSKKIKGKNVLNDLSSGYTFSGSEESVNRLQDALDALGNKGASIDYTPNKVSEINKIDIEMLEDSLNDPTLSTQQRKAIQDSIDAINRKNSTLTINNINMLDDIKNNAEVRKMFDDLDLEYNLEYNADEWNRLQNLGQNKEFTNLAGQYDKTYRDLASRIQETTGIDYSDITDNPGYFRRAKGTIGDSDEIVKELDARIANAPDEQTREMYQRVQNEFKKDLLRGEGSYNKAFGSRKYRQPAEVVNRQYQEALQKEINNINTKIDNLKQNYAVNRKESLTNTLNELNELKTNSIKAEKLKQKGIKYRETLDRISTQIDNTITHANNVMNKIDENIVDKSLKIQDQSISSNLVKQINKSDELNKQIKKLSKQLVDTDNLDENTLKTIQDNLNKANKELLENNNKLRKTVDMIDGHVDETIHKSLEKNAKEIEKYTADKAKIDKYTAQKQQISEKIKFTDDALTSLNNNIDKAIKKTNFSLESVNETRDAFIDKQIIALEQAKSILESKAGKTIFDLNFYGGMDDFIKYAKGNNQTARVFQDALTIGAFDDPNVIRNLTDIDPTNIPSGFSKVNGNDLARRLESVQTMLGLDRAKIDALKETFKNQTFYMDDRAASLFNVLEYSAKNKGANAIMNLFDKTNNLFKKFSVLTPGFHLRNYVGNTMNSYLSGMPLNQIPVYQAKATKVLNSMGDIKDKIAKGIALTADEESNWKLIKQFYDGGFAGAGTAVRDLDKLQDSLKVGGVLNKPGQWSMKANEAVDAMQRMSLLMYANDDLAKGGKYLKKLGAKNPIQAVKYALMDPSNLSDFEVNTMKRLIPFYTFTKQNLMFQATNLGKNIGKYKKVMKAIEDSYADLDEDAYYDYQKSNMQIPILGGTDDEGNQLFLKSNLPLSDLGEFLSDPTGRIASSLTPILKTPIEAKTGKDLFTGQDLNYKTLSGITDKLGIDGGNARNAAQLSELILKNFGLSNISTNLIKKVQAILENSEGEKSSQQMWAEIFRSVLQNTNEENVKQSGLYDELEAYQAEVKRLKNQGIDVPTIKEITASNKLKLNNLKKKRASLR